MTGRRKRLTIDEKIEKQKDVVSRAKDRYDAALNELDQLMQKREQLRKNELIEAFEKSDRSYEEIMEFLAADPVKE